MAKVIISASVGKNGDNDMSDVKVIRKRFRELGFHWVSKKGIGNSPDLIRAIELFQLIFKGIAKYEKKVSGVDGLVSKNGNTHKWLAAINAPGWTKIFGEKGVGWTTTVDNLRKSGGSPYIESNGGYGTTWLLNTIKGAGRAYSKTWKITYPLMWVRDCSPLKGGLAKGHASHQTGIDVDFRLPLKADPILKIADPTWDYLKTRSQRQKRLFREAVDAQLKALASQPLVKYIFYEDDTARPGEKKMHTKWRKVRVESNHEHHFHVRIKPPIRIEGQIL